MYIGSRRRDSEIGIWLNYSQYCFILSVEMMLYVCQYGDFRTKYCSAWICFLNSYYKIILYILRCSIPTYFVFILCILYLHDATESTIYYGIERFEDFQLSDNIQIVCHCIRSLTDAKCNRYLEQRFPMCVRPWDNLKVSARCM